jgi:phosphoenolpyruvate carboxykinase (GTP)
LPFTRQQFDTVTSIDIPAWRQELQSHDELFKQLAARLPDQLLGTKAQFERKLGA